MRSITLIMAYYENAGMLEKHLETFSRYPVEVQENLHVIIVDDGSPNAPAMHTVPKNVSHETKFELSVFRMGEDIPWNQDACRNLGVLHATSDWIMLTDMDHLVPAETMLELMQGEFHAEDVYRFARVSAPDMAPYKPHPNSWFMHRGMYENIGGYDERLAGYYGTDGDFSTRMKEFCRAVVDIKPYLIRVPRSVIPDASTTTLTRKSPEDREMIKQIRTQRGNARPLRNRFKWYRQK